MNFRKIENYRKVIKEIGINYPLKQQEIMLDFFDWINDVRTMPVTQELRQIITKLTRSEK